MSAGRVLRLPRQAAGDGPLILVNRTHPLQLPEETLRERLCELGQFYGQYDVHTPCEALDVSRGPFTTTSSATNGATLGLRSAGRSTVF